MAKTRRSDSGSSDQWRWMLAVATSRRRLRVVDMMPGRIQRQARTPRLAWRQRRRARLLGEVVIYYSWSTERRGHLPDMSHTARAWSDTVSSVRRSSGSQPPIGTRSPNDTTDFITKWFLDCSRITSLNLSQINITRLDGEWANKKIRTGDNDDRWGCSSPFLWPLSP